MNTKQHPLYLVKDKGKRGIFRLLFSRMGIITLLLLLQILFFIALYNWFSSFSWVYSISLIISIMIVIYIVNTNMNFSAKITWLVFIMATPIFGALLFAYTQSNLGHRILKRRVQDLIDRSQSKLVQNPQVIEDLNRQDEGIVNLAHYLRLNGNYPVYAGSRSTYYPSGESKFQAMVEELEKAQNFIFLEYFIIEEGEMWGTILEILARKAREGVDVRVHYDGTCAFSKVPFDYDKKVASLGIKCKIFAPITPFISTHYNYRDHRKILVIDGKVAFNGGVNLANEYININSPFGHWKDAAVKIEGDAVASFTLMFLQLWNIDEEVEDYDQFLSVSQPIENPDGFIVPYADEPLDEDKVGEMVYIDIINRASRYVHIMTPYLILDGELETAIIFAAKRGVKVRLILPGIPDKKVPYYIAKTYFNHFIKAGVEIYLYTPGFIHSKVFLSDDEIGVVGTINLDYRSLYHHFECATLLYQTESLKEIAKDFENTFSLCEKMTIESNNQRPLTEKISGWLGKLIAPLM